MDGGGKREGRKVGRSSSRKKFRRKVPYATWNTIRKSETREKRGGERVGRDGRGSSFFCANPA